MTTPEQKPVAHCEVGHVKGDSGNQCWDPVHAFVTVQGTGLFLCVRHAKAFDRVVKR